VTHLAVKAHLAAITSVTRLGVCESPVAAVRTELRKLVFVRAGALVVYVGHNA
jgi:hypothetical protein